MLGKLNQHTDTFTPDMNSIPPANEVISKKILDKLDNTKVYPKFRGSMGIIYAGVYNDKKIAIKIVPESTKKVVNDEAWVLSCLGICNIVNKSMVDVVKDLELRIKNELSMDMEYKNWSLINQDTLKSFGCRTVRPIHSLCDSDHFVYEYELYKSLRTYIPILNHSKKIDIYMRIVSMYLQSQMNNIFIGDLNCGNFLYDEKLDEIIVIDYGCVMETNQKFRTCMNIFLYNILYANTKYLVSTFCNNSKKCEVLLNQIQHLLSDVETDFANLELDLVIFDIDAITGSKFRPETITILRSLSHLLLLAKKMEIKLNIRKILIKYTPFDGNISKYQPTNIDVLL
jgi:predicted unusual protein kinase regulating ubiquinone biosynthesis (AarF/ABC1/UbiB family)